jgi:hypothetical protein
MEQNHFADSGDLDRPLYGFICIIRPVGRDKDFFKFRGLDLWKRYSLKISPVVIYNRLLLLFLSSPKKEQGFLLEFILEKKPNQDFFAS